MKKRYKVGIFAVFAAVAITAGAVYVVKLTEEKKWSPEDAIANS